MKPERPGPSDPSRSDLTPDEVARRIGAPGDRVPRPSAPPPLPPAVRAPRGDGGGSAPIAGSPRPPAGAARRILWRDSAAILFVALGALLFIQADPLGVLGPRPSATPRAGGLDVTFAPSQGVQDATATPAPSLVPSPGLLPTATPLATTHRKPTPGPTPRPTARPSATPAAAPSQTALPTHVPTPTPQPSPPATPPATAPVTPAPAPVISLACTPVGLLVSCDASVTNGVAVTTWSWDWGDGTSGGLDSPRATHAYTGAGTYTITVTGEGPSGIGSASAEVVVTLS